MDESRFRIERPESATATLILILATLLPLLAHLEPNDVTHRPRPGRHRTNRPPGPTNTPRHQDVNSCLRRRERRWRVGKW